MFKAKHKVSLFAACLTLLLTMVLGIAGIFSTPATTTASAATKTVTDTLNRATTGITGTSYATWSGKKSNSDAVYAGQSAGGNDSIQLRTTNSNSGVVTTASGGKAKKITVEW